MAKRTTWIIAALLLVALGCGIALLGIWKSTGRAPADYGYVTAVVEEVIEQDDGGTKALVTYPVADEDHSSLLESDDPGLYVGQLLDVQYDKAHPDQVMPREYESPLPTYIAGGIAILLGIGLLVLKVVFSGHDDRF